MADTTAFDRRQFSRAGQWLGSRQLLWSTRIVLVCAAVGIGLSFYKAVTEGTTASEALGFATACVFFGLVLGRITVVDPVFRELSRLRAELEDLRQARDLH